MTVSRIRMMQSHARGQHETRRNVQKEGITMLIQTAVIDDQITDGTYLKECIRQSIPEVLVSNFPDTASFLSSDIPLYDLVITDILLGDRNGIDEYQRISERTCFLMYSSVCKEMIAFTFHPKVVGFIAKNDDRKSITAQLKSVFEKYLNVRMTFQTSVGEITIHKNRIAAVRRISKELFLFTDDGRKLLLRNTSLREIKKKADHLIYINKGELVNMKYVRTIEERTLVLIDGSVLYPSRRNCHDIKEAFIRSIMEV